MKRTPNIRFKCFDGEWEEKRISDLADINPKSLLPEVFEYVDLESVVGTTMISHRRENIKTAPSRAQRLASLGDVFFQMVRPYQKNNFYFDIKDTNYVFSTGYAQLRPHINGGFLFSLLQSKKFVDDVLLNCTGSSYPAINPTQLASIITHVAKSPNEQALIETLFTSLDTLISQRAKEVEKMRNIKRALLEKMFPQDGQSVPQIRFKEFIDNYSEEQAKFIFESFVEKNHPELPVLSATQDKGMVTREDIGYQIAHNKSNEATYKRVLPGQFVIHLRSFQGGFAHSAVEGITSPAYDVFGFKENNKHDDYYWKYIFCSKPFIKRLVTVTYGIRDGRNVNYAEFLGLSFSFPQKEEQTKVAKLLQSLDTTISARDRQITLLKNLKLALLEQMFVNN